MISNPPPELSIIIVNWNSVSYLRNCLKSIYDKVLSPGFEVLVIDNASYDGSAALCASQFPQVLFIQGHLNLGFSRANNQAALKARGSTLLFLNPDTEIIDDAVSYMFQHLHSEAKIGAVGCRVLNSDRSLQLKYVQAFPTVWNQMLGTDVLIRLFPNWRLWGFRPMLDYRDQPLKAQVICGSCLMVKKSVFDCIGGFDDHFFMYAEDVALCHAIWQSGSEIHYVGSGTVVHHSEKSSSIASGGSFSDLMQRESMVSFLRKSRGPVCAAFYRLTTALCAAVRLLSLPFLIPFKSRFSSSWRLSAMRRKWWRLLRWALGLESLKVANRGELIDRNAQDACSTTRKQDTVVSGL